MPAPKNLVHETSSSTGTGNMAISAVNGKQRLSEGFSTGGSDTFDYFISNRDGAEWEVGTGSLSDANTLVRDTVVNSSNSNSAVNFSAGTKDITNDIPAENVVGADITQTLTNKTLTSPVINTPALGAGSVDAITEIDAALRTGADTSLVTGTAGTDGDLAVWNGDGDLVDGPTPPSGDIVGLTDTQTLTNKTLDGAVVATSLDMNGVELVLDADGDTSITADTDDTIDIRIAGADDFQITANKFDALTGSTLEAADTGAIKENAVSITPIGKQTIFLPASSLLPATTNGPAPAQVEASTNFQNFTTLDFDASTDEYAHFQIAMPKGYNLGTVTYQVWWTTSATDTDGVAWGLQALARADNEAIDAAWGTAVVVTDDAQGGANEVLVSAESSAVTVGAADDDLTFFRFFRDVSDANDDMTEDARLIGIKLFYTLDAATDT